MNTKMFALKTHLKERAVLLKNLKKERKNREFGYVAELLYERLSYRAHHIVYSMLRGKTLEQIENHRITNPPAPTCYTEWRLKQEIATLMATYKEEVVDAPHL